MTGTLVLVATPIGNLGDLSPRAVETLQHSALILCEDTRHSGKLLSHAGISGVRLAVCNEHTEIERSRDVVALLDAGETVTMITDAGTPGISDPGSRLVRLVVDAGHAVSAVPGPAAFVMGLVVSGFDTTRFVFEGFLPRSGRERSVRLASVAAEPRTTVMYEAPHRIERTVNDQDLRVGVARFARRGDDACALDIAPRRVRDRAGRRPAARRRERRRDSIGAAPGAARPQSQGRGRRCCRPARGAQATCLRPRAGRSSRRGATKG